MGESSGGEWSLLHTQPSIQQCLISWITDPLNVALAQITRLTSLQSMSLLFPVFGWTLILLATHYWPPEWVWS